MTRSQIDDSHERNSLRDGQGSEVAVVSHYETTGSLGICKNGLVGLANHPRLIDIDYVETLGTEKVDHIGMDVPIRQDREIAELHTTPGVR